MNLMSSLLKGAADVAAAGASLVPDDGADGRFGLVTSALAGAAAALAVAIILTVYFQSRYRSPREMVRHGIAAALVLGMIAFVASDIRHAALALLGINASTPAVEYEIRLPRAASSTRVETRVDPRAGSNPVL